MPHLFDFEFQEHHFVSSPTPVLIPIFALGFAIYSFYWMNWRKGKLKTIPPIAFSCAADGATVLRLMFPLIFIADGAKAIVVQDLRLCFPQEPTSVLPLEWTMERPGIQPQSSDPIIPPSAFVVEPKSPQSRVIEFGGPFPGFTLEKKKYRVRIEVITNNEPSWKKLIEFDLLADRVSSPRNYIAYSNRPILLTKEDRAKTSAALKSLLHELNQWSDEASS